MNYYTLVMADDGLPCTEAEADAIDRILQATEEADEPCGFSFEHSGDKGYLKAEENGNIDFVPDEALTKIGALVTRAGLPYLECGVSFTASRLVPGSCGGTAFRILPDGSVIARIETWPEPTPDTPKPLALNEIGNTYVGAGDRFVVSLVVGYGENDEVTTAREALTNALDLTRDGGCWYSLWYVFDRKTGVLTLMEQKFGEPDYDGDQCGECGAFLGSTPECEECKAHRLTQLHDGEKESE
jgi:hypothetical protein